MSVVWGKSNLQRDERAIELAKIALGWSEMTFEQQMDNSRNLITRAQRIKESL